ncbi:MAG: septum formation initiator family protein [Bacteroidaceae bacterium]|nr:septum formation initiator family protein [Candidatus Minthousia equi]MCQ2246814.1 septum formation initiator family protein [Bacteroidaceae bacterium]MDO4956126.1 septum formation initiator family protein [Bacteroidales bacterium]
MNKFLRLLGVLSRYRYIIVIAIAVVFIGFVGENSYMAHLRHQATLKELNEEIAACKKQYDADTRKLHDLNENIEAIKQVAREKYFMKAKNEDVFIFQQ